MWVLQHLLLLICTSQIVQRRKQTWNKHVAKVIAHVSHVIFLDRAALSMNMVTLGDPGSATNAKFRARRKFYVFAVEPGCCRTCRKVVPKRVVQLKCLAMLIHFWSQIWESTKMVGISSYFFRKKELSLQHEIHIWQPSPCVNCGSWGPSEKVLFEGQGRVQGGLKVGCWQICWWITTLTSQDSQRCICYGYHILLNIFNVKYHVYKHINMYKIYMAELPANELRRSENWVPTSHTAPLRLAAHDDPTWISNALHLLGYFW